MEVPSSKDLGCESAIALFNETYALAEQVIQGPKKVLAILDKLIKYPFDAAKTFLDKTLGAVEDIIEEVSDPLDFITTVQDLAKHLERMLECPIIADSPLGKSVAAALDVFDASGDIPGDIVDALKDQIRGGKKAVEDVLDPPASLEEAYDQMLEKANVAGLLQEMDDMKQCLQNLCAGYDAVSERLQGLPDDIINAVGGVVDKTGAVIGTIPEIVMGLPSDVQLAFVKAKEQVTG